MDFINGWTFKYHDGESPGAFNAIPGVDSISGLGADKPLVRVTDFDSTAEEYIGGLADGKEFSLDVNLALGDTVQQQMVDDAEPSSGVDLRKFECVVTDGTDTATLAFSAVPLGSDWLPSYDDRNKKQFRYKISGDITLTRS